MTIDVAKGVFRFTTGHSDKRAYEINTGVASIGVRGTIFEGESAPRKTRLHVVEGVVDVRTKNGRFCELRAGQSAIVTDLACSPISGFDPGFSPELSEFQEFSQLQPGEQGIFAAENPAMYLVPAAVVAGGVATARGDEFVQRQRRREFFSAAVALLAPGQQQQTRQPVIH